MTSPARQSLIGENTSIGLDTMRLLAAGVVFVMHGVLQWNVKIPAALDGLSHAAVVVFFVISGYVIAYTTATNNRGPRQYATARLSRLYSLVLPALLLTAVAELAVKKLDYPLALTYSRPYAWLRYLMSAVYCNESTLFSASPAMNTPLWSLSFEFWYYAIFGLWLFRESIRNARLLLVVACCIAGPKILAMLPIWLLGVWVYKTPKPALPTVAAWASAGLLLVVAGLAVVYLPALPFPLGRRPLYFANQFLKDWLVGVCFALALWLLPESKTTYQARWVAVLRTAADLSFPIYVFHYPLLVLWRAAVGWHPGDARGMWWAIAAVGGVAIALGLFFERRRRAWVRLFKYLFASSKWPLGIVKAR